MTTIKAKTKETFMINAQKLFTEKGIAETYMEDIAQASDKTRRTLYRHFKTKEDLAHEVLIDILSEWNDFQLTTRSALKGTGLNMLKEFLDLLILFMVKEKSKIRFMATFDVYFDDQKNSQVDPDILERLSKIALVSDEIIQNIIEAGIKDGSIIIKQPLELVVATISSVLLAYGQRIAIRGEIMSEEYHINPMDMLYCQIEMYMAYLSAE